MNNFNGLENIAPAILKFPIEKTIKAIVNLKLGRKVTSSIVRLIALVLGLVFGYFFPQIGNFMAFLIGLVATTPVSVILLSTASMITSMFLSAVVFIYIAKKTMGYYYMKKYGVSDPEHRFTEKDRNLFQKKFIDLAPEDLNKLIKKTEERVSFLVSEMSRFKATNQLVPYKNAKYALYRIKLGEIEAFADYCAEDGGKQSGIPSSRQQRIAKLLESDTPEEVGSAYKKLSDEIAKAAKDRKSVHKSKKPQSDEIQKRLYNLKKNSEGEEVSEDEFGLTSMFDIRPLSNL